MLHGYYLLCETIIKVRNGLMLKTKEGTGEAGIPGEPFSPLRRKLRREKIVSSQ
jgi:hypothetical protein